MQETFHRETCKGCGGSGVQKNNEGININCPVCGGTGIKWVSNFDGLPPGIYCITREGGTTGG